MNLTELEIILIVSVTVLVASVLVSLYALRRRKDIKNGVRLPWGIRWDMETRTPPTEKATQHPQPGVDMGTGNRIGKTGDISGGHMVKGPANSELLGKTGKNVPGVYMGEENVIDSTGDISGGNMIKTDQD